RHLAAAVAHELGARRDGDPARRLAVEVPEQRARGQAAGLDVELLAQVVGTLLDRQVPPRAVAEPDPLALAVVRAAAQAEHRLHVVPGVRRRGHDLHPAWLTGRTARQAPTILRCPPT